MRPDTPARSTTGPARPQLDLPGQRHVAEGPHDLSGMYVMHHAFRRDLASLGSSVRETPLGDTATWQALARRWARFAAMLHHHHTAEDEAYWPRLARAVEVRGTGRDREEVAAMAGEHAGIDPALEACQDAVTAMVDHPCEAHRGALDIRVTGLGELLHGHLEHEETVVLPMLQRIWTDEEFAAAEASVRRYHPLRDLLFLVPWVIEGLPASDRERVLGTAGAGYRMLYRLGRPGFARLEAAAFRYAVPQSSG